MAVFVDFNYDSMIFYFENFIGRGHITQKRSRNAKLIMYVSFWDYGTPTKKNPNIKNSVSLLNDLPHFNPPYPIVHCRVLSFSEKYEH